ncbi:MAG TPA: KTSC domain-containing protein [Rhizobiaceae bacterium]|nr:KTSC domain-containing protein [Rhizobiaceae bacterium]
MAKVERIDIPHSDAIAAVFYLPERRGLEVMFQSASVYLYRGVPPDVAYGFSHTDSAGRYFHEHILNCYPFRRLK